MSGVRLHTIASLLVALGALFSLDILADQQPAKKNPPALTQNTQLAEKLEAVRAANKVPALWGAIVLGDKVVAIAAVGVRKDGEATPVTLDDQVHIGSDTKAMTATIIALLVEQKKLRWDSTIVEVFPDLKGKIHEDYLDVTITQLLGHRGGLIANSSAWGPTPAKLTNRQYRRELLPKILKEAPESRPGSTFNYSNTGYVIAGAMAEEASGESWEDLMAKRLFQPLGMTSAGFGAPGTKGKVDQPWGHRLAKEKRFPLQFDNVAVMGPAGTVHVSVPDWAKFATLHLRGDQGKGQLLKPATFKHLHTPLAESTYACGWGTRKDGMISHDGSNTLWYSRIAIFPYANVAFLIAINQGGDEAQKACNEANKVIDDFYIANYANK